MCGVSGYQSFCFFGYFPQFCLFLLSVIDSHKLDGLFTHFKDE